MIRRAYCPSVAALLLAALMTTSAAGMTVLSENFAGFTGALGTEILNFDAVMQSPGWTGSKVYPSNQVAKLGSSSAKGILTTPTIDLSGNAGQAVLAFDSWWWSAADATKIQILHAADGATFVQAGSDVQLSATPTRYTINISGGAAQSKLRLQALNETGERFFIDNLEVSQEGSGDDPNISMPGTLAFGKIEPGTVKTQLLSIANTGLSNALAIASFGGLSGDVASFSLGAVPAAVAHGAATNVPVVYTPGTVSNATHSAVFQLVCNDPSNPTNNVTFTGLTSGPALTVSNIQYTTNPGGGSVYSGQVVDVEGVVTYLEPTSYGSSLPINFSAYAISDAQGGPWSGVYVYDNSRRPDLGDRVRITAFVDEYYGLTELKNVTAYTLLGRSNTVPATAVACAHLGQEAYEGVLVCVSNVTVTSANYNNYSNEWQVTDGTGTLIVGTRCPYRYIARAGQTLTAVIGHVYYSFGANRLQPRADEDIVGRPVMSYALRGLVMTPEGPRSNWYVHVLDDTIAAVADTPPAGVPAVDTQGIIFPGLIDAHNHPTYNSFPTLQFNNFPFGHRDEWAEDPEYDDWKSKRSVVNNNASVRESQKGTVSKWAEALQLMAGCVIIQGNYSDKVYAHPDMLLYNVERFPSRVYAEIFPWTMSAGERASLRNYISNGLVDATLIHLCEGPDSTALAQFANWRDSGMLDGTTAIIHGTPLGSNEFAQMAAVGAKLIWSPMSNMKLFEATANARLAHQLGVLVSISPDWTPSGCANMLEELNYGWVLNQKVFDGYFTPRQLCEMVASNTAAACGLAGRYGIIRQGWNAGLVVVDGNWGDPYMALIAARPRTVKMTVVDGMPRYGDPPLLQALGITGETFNAWGVTKMLNTAVDHPLVPYSGETIATIRANLQGAHATLYPVNELEPDELQFLDLHLVQAGPDNVAPYRAENPVSSPANGAQFITDDPSSMSYRWQDFWDNWTASRDLVNDIAIVDQASPATVYQTIATARTNTPANQTLPFTPVFQAPGNCVFRFITADELGNMRTTVVNAVAFTVVPEPFACAPLVCAALLLFRRTRCL